MKKDEKDAGSRRWNALMSLASFESGYFALNLRSRDCSWRVEGEALRLRFFAGCRLARGRSAPRRLPRVLRAHPSHDAELCRRLLEEGLLMGCCTASGFKFYPPLASLTFFSSCRKL